MSDLIIPDLSQGFELLDRNRATFGELEMIRTVRAMREVLNAAFSFSTEIDYRSDLRILGNSTYSQRHTLPLLYQCEVWRRSLPASIMASIFFCRDIADINAVEFIFGNAAATNPPRYTGFSYAISSPSYGINTIASHVRTLVMTTSDNSELRAAANFITGHREGISISLAKLNSVTATFDFIEKLYPIPVKLLATMQGMPLDSTASFLNSTITASMRSIVSPAIRNFKVNLTKCLSSYQSWTSTDILPPLVHPLSFAAADDSVYDVDRVRLTIRKTTSPQPITLTSSFYGVGILLKEIGYRVVEVYEPGSTPPRYWPVVII